MKSRESLNDAIYSALIDQTRVSNGELRPNLILNDPPETNVLATLINELEQCEYFQFSVAFITRGGLATLFQTLLNLKDRGIKGRIITTDYLNFSDPEALESLLYYFSNIEVRIYTEKPFHTKGYLFQHPNFFSVIIGSSNLTQKALTVTREWNLKLVAMQEGELLQSTQKEFNKIWEESAPLSQGWINHYRKIKEAFKKEPLLESEKISPNIMQKEALESLHSLRQKGETKALLISATGSGKTYLSAMDVKAFAPKKFLFIVHRQQIAEAAERSFKTILGEDIRTSILAGEKSLDKEAIFVFAMVQTLAKESVLKKFDKDEFNYIVIDEVHRAGAKSYEKIISHFNPEFLLGMTATPERTDGYDIYKVFDHNIAYEIRLNQALEANLLAPFHYYGISQLTISGKEYDDLDKFNKLERDEWVKQVQKTIDKYSIGLQQRRGIIFCSRNEEATYLSNQLNNLGWKTRALSGEDNLEKRDRAFTDLEKGDLQYLVAVDILNEGIDIPSLNQIIMIRPTQSAIIFVQQLGRGLRKFPGKEYLTAIDFVGNYTNNYLIPIALYGDTSYKKDNLRKLISSGSLPISGESTINFDNIAKERIYKAINDTSFKTIKILKEQYQKVKYKIGRIPTMMDFCYHGAISPLLFVDYAKNYPIFKSKVDSEYQLKLTPLHLKSLNFLSKVITSGLRPYEMVIIKEIIKSNQSLTLNKIEELIREQYGFDSNEIGLKSAISILQNEFYKPTTKKGFGDISYIEWQGDYLRRTSQFTQLLKNKPYIDEIEDILEVGQWEFSHFYFPKRREDDFVLYKKYSREDVCRILGWEKDESSTLYGYKVDYVAKECPIFVTYDKKLDEIDSSIHYEDYFISPTKFAWETKNQRTLQSREVQAIQKEHYRKLLFIKKSDDEGLSFYYMGDLIHQSSTQGEKVNSKGVALPVVAMTFKMKDKVISTLYNYLQN